MAKVISAIYLYSNGECRADEFIEDNKLSFRSDGTVHYLEFIEGSSSIRLSPNAFYASELIEHDIAYLTDESDTYLTDEFGNRLTTLVL